MVMRFRRVKEKGRCETKAVVVRAQSIFFFGMSTPTFHLVTDAPFSNSCVLDNCKQTIFLMNKNFVKMNVSNSFAKKHFAKLCEI